MTTTITSPSSVYTATQVDGYSAVRPSRNVLHPIIGSGAYAVSLRPAALRSGTLRVMFTDEQIANDLLDALSAGTELSLESTDRPLINMNFVASGDSELELDDETRKNWWVIFDWQETE